MFGCIDRSHASIGRKDRSLRTQQPFGTTFRKRPSSCQKQPEMTVPGNNNQQLFGSDDWLQELLGEQSTTIRKRKLLGKKRNQQPFGSAHCADCCKIVHCPVRSNNHSLLGGQSSTIRNHTSPGCQHQWWYKDTTISNHF